MKGNARNVWDFLRIFVGTFNSLFFSFNLYNGYPVVNRDFQVTTRRAAHSRIGIVGEYPIPGWYTVDLNSDLLVGTKPTSHRRVFLS